MKTLRYLILAVSFTVLSACAQMGSSVLLSQGKIAEGDHGAMISHYQTLANEAKDRLTANKKILDDYEARPYYYGRRGLDLQSHATANIRAYEKEFRKNLELAEFHKRMAVKQAELNGNSAEAHLENEYISDKPVQLEKTKL